MGLHHFAGSGGKADLVYTYGSGQLYAAARETWRHTASTPQRPQSNGIAEQAVRQMLGGRHTTASVAVGAPASVLARRV